MSDASGPKPDGRRWAFGLVPCASLLLSLFVLSGCAPGRIAFPTDAGAPLPDFASIHAQLSTACTGVRTLTAELSLAGQVGPRRVSGRVLAGFERPASLRLEGVAPFGPPAFVLAARDVTAVLLLPRDDRVVRGASAEDLLDALTGVKLSPADLQAVLTGCVVEMPHAMGGHLHQKGWASIDLEGGATLYLQRMDAGWRLRAARRGEWEIEYPAWDGAFPHAVRLRSAMPGQAIDLTATLSQLETNVAVDAAAFTVNVPSSAAPIALDEIRARVPLGAR